MIGSNDFGFSVSEESKSLSKDYDKSENDLKALQSVGQVSNQSNPSGRHTVADQFLMLISDRWRSLETADRG